MNPSIVSKPNLSKSKNTKAIKKILYQNIQAHEDPSDYNLVQARF